MTMLLFFTMPLDETQELNRGRLFLIDETQGIVGRWVATTSTADKQGVNDWDIHGGVLPPTYQLSQPLPFYSVAVNPLNLEDVKGVEGNGYPITPFKVTTKNGVTRSDLLIHRDANVPGSMGCIVLLNDEFADFEKVFQAKCKEYKEVNLLVGYTY